MKDKIFVIYDKKDGKIRYMHRFGSLEDSPMPTESEMMKRCLDIASRDIHLSRSQMDIIKVKNELKGGSNYIVDLKSKSLKRIKSNKIANKIFTNKSKQANRKLIR
jgi:hypothetical protein